jgi:hypothetical protein
MSGHVRGSKILITGGAHSRSLGNSSLSNFARKKKVKKESKIAN